MDASTADFAESILVSVSPVSLFPSRPKAASVSKRLDPRLDLSIMSDSVDRTPARPVRPTTALGLRTQQGVIPGIKAYAAHHASREEALREAKALGDLLSSRDFNENRKRFIVSTESKVRAAVEERLQSKSRSLAPEDVDEDDDAARGAANISQIIGSLGGAGAGSSSSAPPMRPSSARTARPASATRQGTTDLSTADLNKLDLSKLIEQRRALLAANFEEQANELSVIIAAGKEQEQRKREELEQRLYRQQLTTVEASQNEQLEQLVRDQTAEATKMSVTWREELTAVTEFQAREVQEYEMRITRAAEGEVELPRELNKYRFKPSTTLQKIRKGIAGLPNAAAGRRMHFPLILLALRDLDSALASLRFPELLSLLDS